MGSVVAHDLLFDGSGVVAPWSRLDHALQIRVRRMVIKWTSAWESLHI